MKSPLGSALHHYYFRDGDGVYYRLSIACRSFSLFSLKPEPQASASSLQQEHPHFLVESCLRPILRLTVSWHESEMPSRIIGLDIVALSNHQAAERRNRRAQSKERECGEEELQFYFICEDRFMSMPAAELLSCKSESFEIFPIDVMAQSYFTASVGWILATEKREYHWMWHPLAPLQRLAVEPAWILIWSSAESRFPFLLVAHESEPTWMLVAYDIDSTGHQFKLTARRHVEFERPEWPIQQEVLFSDFSCSWQGILIFDVKREPNLLLYPASVSRSSSSLLLLNSQGLCRRLETGSGHWCYESTFEFLFFTLLVLRTTESYGLFLVNNGQLCLVLEWPIQRDTSGAAMERVLTFARASSIEQQAQWVLNDTLMCFPLSPTELSYYGLKLLYHSLTSSESWISFQYAYFEACQRMKASSPDQRWSLFVDLYTRFTFSRDATQHAALSLAWSLLVEEWNALDLSEQALLSRDLLALKQFLIDQQRTGTEVEHGCTSLLSWCAQQLVCNEAGASRSIFDVEVTQELFPILYHVTKLYKQFSASLSGERTKEWIESYRDLGGLLREKRLKASLWLPIQQQYLWITNDASERGVQDGADRGVYSRSLRHAFYVLTNTAQLTVHLEKEREDEELSDSLLLLKQQKLLDMNYWRVNSLSFARLYAHLQRPGSEKELAQKRAHSAHSDHGQQEEHSEASSASLLEWISGWQAASLKFSSHTMHPSQPMNTSSLFWSVYMDTLEAITDAKYAHLFIRAKDGKLNLEWLLSLQPGSSTQSFGQRDAKAAVPLNEPQFGGLLLGLAMAGHLSSLPVTLLYELLAQANPFISIPLWLGLSWHALGTGDRLLTKILCLHLPSLTGSTSLASFSSQGMHGIGNGGVNSGNSASATRLGAIMSLALLYFQSGNRGMIKILWREILIVTRGSKYWWWPLRNALNGGRSKIQAKVSKPELLHAGPMNSFIDHDGAPFDGLSHDEAASEAAQPIHSDSISIEGLLLNALIAIGCIALGKPETCPPALLQSLITTATATEVECLPMSAYLPASLSRVGCFLALTLIYYGTVPSAFLLQRLHLGRDQLKLLRRDVLFYWHVCRQLLRQESEMELELKVASTAFQALLHQLGLEDRTSINDTTEPLFYYLREDSKGSWVMDDRTLQELDWIEMSSTLALWSAQVYALALRHLASHCQKYYQTVSQGLSFLLRLEFELERACRSMGQPGVVAAVTTATMRMKMGQGSLRKSIDSLLVSLCLVMRGSGWLPLVKLIRALTVWSPASIPPSSLSFRCFLSLMRGGIGGFERLLTWQSALGLLYHQNELRETYASPLPTETLSWLLSTLPYDVYTVPGCASATIFGNPNPDIESMVMPESGEPGAVLHPLYVSASAVLVEGVSPSLLTFGFEPGSGPLEYWRLAWRFFSRPREPFSSSETRCKVKEQDKMHVRSNADHAPGTVGTDSHLMLGDLVDSARLARSMSRKEEHALLRAYTLWALCQAQSWSALEPSSTRAASFNQTFIFNLLLDIERNAASTGTS